MGTTTAEIIQLQKKPEAKFLCSACGADRGCNCNAPAIPKFEEARRAVNANPHKSNRAIANEIGIGPATVDRARKSVASHEAPERIGKDGKTYRIRKPLDEDIPSAKDAEKSEQESLYRHARDAIEYMSEPTRRRLFAYIREKYHAEIE